MSISAENTGEPASSQDAIRQRRKESELPSSSPQSVDVEKGDYTEHTKVKRKRPRDFGLCLNFESGKDGEGEYRVSGPYGILSLLILLGIGLLIVKHLDGRLPRALQVEDIIENPHSFIEERARKDLHDLIQVGVRVAGSEATDKHTVDLFLKILADIKGNVLSSENTLEFEVQRPTGAFFMDDDEGQISSYSKIANVVAKLEPANPSNKRDSSILVNCHFDTKPGSPGATDNMISCATMLEVIRVLAGETPTSLRNTIIFLFNGAEELGLQGAHGFVKGYDAELGNPDKAEEGHKWAKNLRTFINLEGAGGGGREILFQTGPGNSWTLEAYAKAAPYPYGLALAEEAFQLGLIPSDTDFRIFRDFRDLPGLDMAFIKNGWVYHTKWDKLSEIPAGSIQHMGANSLAILKHFTKLDFTKIEESEGKVVFFDVMGLFMIYYPRWAAMLIDCVVAVGTITTIIFYALETGKNKLKLVPALIWLPISAILSWAAGISVAGLVAVFLNACGYAKPFYSYPFLATVIFGIPAAIAQILVHSYTQRKSPTQTWMAQKLALAVILLIATFITRAVYVITINLLFSVIAWNLTRYLCRGWARAITLTYLIIGEIIPFLMSAYLLVTLSDVFVPILGRSGSETNANLFFGLITSGIVTVLIWNGFVFIFVSFRRRVLWTSLFTAFFVLNTVLVFGFVGKVPYQEKTPMRLNLANVDRTWYATDGNVEKTEAGYWLWPYDSNSKDFFSTFEKYAPEFASVKDVQIDYETCKDLYCGQPFMWPVTKSIKTTYWLPLKEGLSDGIKDPVTMTYTITGSPGDSRRTVKFAFDGPTQIAIVLSPGPRYKLSSWSLTKEIPRSGLPWKGRSTYFIFHSRGMQDQTISFSCNFELVSGTENPGTGPLVNVQYSAFHLHGNSLMTPEFLDLVNRLPSWTYTMPWTVVMKMYELR